eukprot:TRINITY_DN12538_c0_g2_i1.p1 TRINITY_DN12538_c0_g2~~TRINITY_DN12538_c0_g2_i1.p1  ORF type:complete len:284 (+),score=33.52 TRINITY_DN12538_c0_g2_i1:331-1182(+)
MSSIDDFRRCGFMADATTFANSSEQDSVSIGVIMTIFGEWPPWFPWYLETAARNRHIDFHVVHDSGAPGVVERMALKGVPSNIWFHYDAFETLRDKAKNAGLADLPSAPYEANAGLRPFYGFLYQHILAPYRFWGWGDYDVIYGRLDRFYNRETLEKFDAIGTGCCNRTSGPLAFFRNTEEVNNKAKMKGGSIGLNGDESFQTLFDAEKFSANNTECPTLSFQLRAGALFSDGHEYSHMHFGGGDRHVAMEKKLKMATNLVRACPVHGDVATCGACFPSLVSV